MPGLCTRHRQEAEGPLGMDCRMSTEQRCLRVVEGDTGPLPDGLANTQIAKLKAKGEETEQGDVYGVERSTVSPAGSAAVDPGSHDCALHQLAARGVEA